MISLSRDDLLKVVGGKSVPTNEKLTFTGVQFDSREIKGGELFVALKGEKSHGHNYLQEAENRGAALFLVEDPVYLKHNQMPERFILVSDTQRALNTLANWWRKELNVPVLAITGSVGKTTVKEMTAAILLKHSRGIYSAKSFNNRTGVPHSILRLSKEHKWLVLEIGMNHQGEIRDLVKIAQPDVAVITCIAPSHIGYLGSMEAIARAKLEILEGVKHPGTIILNGADEILMSEYNSLGPRLANHVMLFGECDNSSARLLSVTLMGIEGVELKAEINGEEFTAKLSTIGTQSAANAVVAALSAKALMPEISKNQIVQGLSAFRAPLMRMHIIDIGEDRKVIDDSYNSNPVTVKALLEVVPELISGGKRVGLLIGDMLELGLFSERYHREIAQYIVDSKVSFIVGVGESIRATLDIARQAGIPCFEAENPEVAAHIARKLNFDILLVKGSRGIGLDRSVKVLEGTH